MSPSQQTPRRSTPISPLRAQGPERPQPAPPPAFRTLARRALVFVRPHTPRVVLIIALALVAAALGAAEPLVLKRIFDELGGGGGARPLAFALLALLCLEVARAALGGWLSIVTWRVRLSVDYGLRERLIGKLHSLPLTFHQGQSVGGTVNRVNQTISGFLNAFAELAFNVVPTVAYLAMSVIAMLQMEWRLAVVVLAFTPLPALIGAWAAREQTQRERLLLDRWTVLYSRFNEILAGIRTVKAFAMEEVERRRFLSGQREGNEIVRRGVRIDTLTGALRGFAATLARLAAIALGSVLILRGQITVGTLVAVLGYIGGLFGPVQGLTNVYQTLQRGRVALETLFDILDTPDPVADRPGAVELTGVRGAVRFERLDFSYSDGTQVLSGIDLDVAPGEMIALVGPSGSGKTSLMTLLQRMFPLEHGRILIDGVDIRDVTQHSLRRNIGIVYQDVNLFNDTIRDNIAYGRPSASDEEIEAVARAACAHEFIMALPEGYDTVVGERGSRLSGGQRQRIGIARALLLDPPILVFDEATSALDSESEAWIQQALRSLTRGRTTFVIAHRLSTVVDADRIAVLDRGSIVAIGRHEELVRSCSLYANLVRRQADGLRLHVA